MDTHTCISRHAAQSHPSDSRIGTTVLAGWLVYAMLGLLGVVGTFLPATPLRADRFGTPGNQWPGIWFICEFAQRQRPPDDACQMFDDEGFQLANGQLSYLRNYPF